MPIVTIRIQSDDVIPVFIQGVVVEFYSTLGGFQTSGTTDVAGEVTVTLPAAFYDVVMFKTGVTILPKQPQQIQALTQVPPNLFLVTGHIRTMPQSIDPDKCRVSGFIIDSQGKPQKGVKITIGPIPELIDVGNKLVDPDHQIMVTSDDKGYIEFDLLRRLKYEAFILYKTEWLGMPPGRLDILAPDTASVLLEYLLFPIPENITFSTSALTVPVGTQDDSSTIMITYTDGNVRQLPLQWGTYILTVSNPDIFEFEIAGDTVLIKGLLAGSATLTAERLLPKTSVWLPEPPFSTDTLTVTVI